MIIIIIKLSCGHVSVRATVYNKRCCGVRMVVGWVRWGQGGVGWGWAGCLTIIELYLCQQVEVVGLSAPPRVIHQLSV